MAQIAGPVYFAPTANVNSLWSVNSFTRIDDRFGTDDGLNVTADDTDDGQWQTYTMNYDTNSSLSKHAIWRVSEIMIRAKQKTDGTTQTVVNQWMLQSDSVFRAGANLTPGGTSFSTGGNPIWKDEDNPEWITMEDLKDMQIRMKIATIEPGEFMDMAWFSIEVYGWPS